MSYFNSFRSNDQYRTQHVKYSPPNPPPQTTVIVKQPVIQMPKIQAPLFPQPAVVQSNTTINNGPQNGTASFWGGFLGALGSSVLGALNKSAEAKQSASVQQEKPTVDFLKNLNKIFPNAIDNGDGTYTVQKHDGTYLTGTYQDLIKSLETKQGPDKPEVKPREDQEDEKPEAKYPDAMNASDASALKGKSLTVQDEGYANSDFSTKVSDLKYKDGADKTKDFPQTLTLTTARGKTLELTFSKMDGNEAVYTSKGQEYRLENGSSGPVLTQKEGDAGYGNVNYHRPEL